MLNLLLELKKENLISDLNYQFARLIDNKQQQYNYSQLERNLAVLLAALISYQIGQGHTALRLNSPSATNFFELKNKPQAQHFLVSILQKIEKMPRLEWQNILKNHIAFSNTPEKIAPMLFQNNLLYFYRYWQAEHNIANYFTQSRQLTENTDIKLDRTILNRLFPEKSESIDWQKIAVATALQKEFCMISGGPGTGKTTTVIKLLAALQIKNQQKKQPFLNIALAAPTGKAASRMEESIGKNLNFLNLQFLTEKEEKEIREHIPQTAKTIHHLLGIRPLTDKAKYHKQNPLPYDLLVVDEASMIDLSLMEKLIQAIRPTARLIILGDKDQLASVEAGAIMGELGEFTTLGYSSMHTTYLNQVTDYKLSSITNTSPICDSLCHLQESRRFDKNSGIFKLAQQVNIQAKKSWGIFREYQDLECHTYPKTAKFKDKSSWLEFCINQVTEQAVILYREYLQLVKKYEQNPQSVQVEQIIESFQKVRFLSALRVGELGMERLNQRIAEVLRSKGLVNFVHSRDRYIGKPILITENSDKLSGGDLGIILVNESGELRVYFDKKDKFSNKLLNLPLSQVTNYEVAYVMTVHKSQGSEFEHSLLILPTEISPVLSKELLYTAITRAKNKFSLFGSEKVWNYSVGTKIERQSGLKEQINNISCK